MKNKKKLTKKATNVVGPGGVQGVQELEAKLALVTKQAAENLAGWKRAQADYQNHLKRSGEQRAQLVKTAAAEVIRGILPVLDNLEQVVAHAGSANPELKKGAELVAKQLREVLASHGLVEIKAVGSIFDPSMHEAVASVPGSKDTCVVEHARGYKLYEVVLRPSRVSVGNGAPSNSR